MRDVTGMAASFGLSVLMSAHPCSAHQRSEPNVKTEDVKAVTITIELNKEKAALLSEALKDLDVKVIKVFEASASPKCSC